MNNTDTSIDNTESQVPPAAPPPPVAPQAQPSPASATDDAAQDTPQAAAPENLPSPDTGQPAAPATAAVSSDPAQEAGVQTSPTASASNPAQRIRVPPQVAASDPEGVAKAAQEADLNQKQANEEFQAQKYMSMTDYFLQDGGRGGLRAGPKTRKALDSIETFINATDDKSRLLNKAINDLNQCIEEDRETCLPLRNKLLDHQVFNRQWSMDLWSSKELADAIAASEKGKFLDKSSFAGGATDLAATGIGLYADHAGLATLANAAKATGIQANLLAVPGMIDSGISISKRYAYNHEIIRRNDLRSDNLATQLGLEASANFSLAGPAMESVLAIREATDKKQAVIDAKVMIDALRPKDGKTADKLLGIIKAYQANPAMNLTLWSSSELHRGINAGSDVEDAINIGVSGAGIVAVFLGSPAALAIGVAASSYAVVTPAIRAMDRRIAQNEIERRKNIPGLQTFMK